MNPNLSISDLNVGDIIADKSSVAEYHILVVRFITRKDRSRKIVIALIDAASNEVLYVCNDVFTNSQGSQTTLVGSDGTIPSWWPHHPFVARQCRKLAREYAHIPVGDDIELPSNRQVRAVIGSSESFIQQAVEMLRYAQIRSIAELRILELFGASLTPEQRALWVTISEIERNISHEAHGGEIPRDSTKSIKEFTTDLAELPSRHFTPHSR